MDVYQQIVALEAGALEASAEHRHMDAIRAHKQALSLSRQLERVRLTAVLFNRLGRALEAWGVVQQAVHAYELGLKALASDPSLNLQKELNSLGSVSKGFGVGSDVGDVPDLYSEATARDLDAEQENPALPAVLLINIGNAYLRQPQEEPALNAYRRALERPETAAAPLLRAYALANSAEILRRRGDTAAAETSLDETLALFAAHAPAPERRRALALLAGIYRDRGDSERSLETYHEALRLYAEVEDTAGEARARAGIGLLHMKLGRFGEAREAYRRARELARAAADRDSLWHASWGLGQCLRRAGELDEAAVLLRESLDLILARQSDLRTDEGKVTFLDSVQEVFDQLIGVHLELTARGDADGHRRALEVAEESRSQALLDMMSGRERVRPEQAQFGSGRGRRPHQPHFSPVSQMAPGVPSFDDFNPASQMAPSTPSDFSLPPWPFDEASTGDKYASAAVAESDLSELTDERAAATNEPPPAPAPLARLVFHVMAEQTAVFAVTADGEVSGYVIAVGHAELARRVARVRRALHVDDGVSGMSRNTRVDDAPDGEAAIDPHDLLVGLYELLIVPCEAALPERGATLVIEPHGALWLLPFAALVRRDGGWLSDQWPLLYAPSWETLKQIRAEVDYGRPADLKALLVGNPAMPELRTASGEELKLAPLSGAEEEVRLISEMFAVERCTIKIGADADRASVEELIPQYGILHFATHGLADSQDPLSSFVVLGGVGDEALLTARHIMYKAVAADLVTLSACQTGLGKVSGEGVIGLCRAFLVAGARTTLVSLWSVSDRATAELMTAFYRHYLEHDDKATALQRAARELRNTPEFEKPRYWAPFIVAGAET